MGRGDLARWAGLGVGFGRAGRAGVALGVEFGRAGRAGLGWAWGLAVLGALGWVGRGVWPCWARWAGLGVEFGRVGRAGVVLGVEFGRAGRGGLGWRGCAGRGGLGWALGAVGWVGRGLWPCCGLGVGGGVAWAKNLAMLCEDLWDVFEVLCRLC